MKSEPYGIEIHECDGIFLKQYFVPNAHCWMPQHSHTYDHLTMLVRGAVRVWKDGLQDADYFAPKGILIKAGVKHLFCTLTNDTELWCVHSLRTPGMVEILAEHQLSDYALPMNSRET